MPTAVVTGGAGFLGSHLSDSLIARDFRVICIDNLDTGSLQNVEHLRGENYTFINQDVTSYVDVPEVVDEVDRLGNVDVGRHVLVDERVVLAAEVLDVLERSRIEIVDADHPEIAGDQRIGEVGAEEPGPAGDDGGRHRADAIGGVEAGSQCLRSLYASAFRVLRRPI